MATGRRDGLYWACWLLAALFTALVTGLMLGHALILAPFLSWMLVTGPPGTLDHTYPAFRATAGAVGLTVFYLLAGVQVAMALGFLVAAVAMRRHRAAASLCWVIVCTMRPASGRWRRNSSATRRVAPTASPAASSPGTRRSTSCTPAC